MTRVVLASRSPRRREILSALGIDYEVLNPKVAEVADGDPPEIVLENARRKARSGLTEAGDDTTVIGADTEVVLDGRVLGQPGSERDARSHLEVLSGRSHTVLTGVVVLERGSGGGSPAERSGVALSEVTFHELDAATVDLYLRSEEWRGRAGAYAIQGFGSILVARLEGDFSNVVGLPVPLLLRLAPGLLPG